MKIYFIPKGTNPYQDLLYSELRKLYPLDQFTYLAPSKATFFFYPILFIVKRFQGYQVFHIHFLIFHVSHKVPLAKLFSYYYTISCLYLIKILGYKIVWTIHDVIPYDNWIENYDYISKLLSRLAEAKIVHSKSVINEMRINNLNISNTYMIPHGNFIGRYPDHITRQQARTRLRIEKDETVILFFGSILPYKGVQDLIRVFQDIGDKNTRLIIAGENHGVPIEDAISKAQNIVHIDYYEGRVPDKDIASYFMSCDVVCLPFKKITTSGSAILALSFGKPIITPRIGALSDFPKNVGYLYDPNQIGALKESLMLAINNKHKLNKLGSNAKRYAESLSWSNIAFKTHEVYESILRHPNAGNNPSL